MRQSKSRHLETKSGVRPRQDKLSGPQTELLYLKVVAKEGDDKEEEELCHFRPPPFPLAERPCHFPFVSVKVEAGVAGTAAA